MSEAKEITITKKQIIKAIQRGELGHHGWVQNSQLPYVGDCRVCAVGAVFRHALKLPNNVVDVLASEAGVGSCDPVSAKSALEREDWLTALSHVFECDAGRYAGIEKQRKVVIDFVEKNFPAKVAIEPSALEAARDEAFQDLLFYADSRQDFEHPFPRRNTKSKYTQDEREVLIKAFSKYLRKKYKDEERDE